MYIVYYYLRQKEMVYVTFDVIDITNQCSVID